MTQVIAGTGSDLTETAAQLLKELIENNWPVSGYDPIKSDVKFGLDVWDNYGDIQIHFTPDESRSVPLNLSGSYSQITDFVRIALFVRKNQEEVPINMGNTQRKIEAIIKGNVAGLGQGVTAIRFDGWQAMNANNNLPEVWRVFGRASAIYFKATT